MKNIMFILVLFLSFVSCKKEEPRGPEDSWEYYVIATHSFEYTGFAPNDGFAFGLTNISSYGGDAKSGKGEGATYSAQILLSAAPTSPVVVWLKVRKNGVAVFEGELDDLTPNNALEFNYQMSFN